MPRPISTLFPYTTLFRSSMPIAVRYTQDAFSRSGWLWPVDAKGEPLKATSYMAVGFYVAKYVNKKSDMDLAAKGLGAKEWNNSQPYKIGRAVQQECRDRYLHSFPTRRSSDLVCPSQFATRRTLFHVLVGCGLLMLKVSRLKLPVIWLLVSMWLNTLTKSQIWTLLLKV